MVLYHPDIYSYSHVGFSMAFTVPTEALISAIIVGAHLAKVIQNDRVTGCACTKTTNHVRYVFYRRFTLVCWKCDTTNRYTGNGPIAGKGWV